MQCRSDRRITPLSMMMPVAGICLLVAERAPSQDPKGTGDDAQVVRPHRRSKPSNSGAVLQALRWLTKAQNQDGSWNGTKSVPDVGTTGLATLAFLANNTGEGETRGKQTADRALQWLAKQIDPKKGSVGKATGRTWLYGHAIATWALVQGFGKSKDDRVRALVQQAVDFIAGARNPYKVWRYYPRDGDNDSSVTGWMALALIAAKEQGFRTDADSLKYVAAWFNEVTNPTDGRVGYRKRGGPAARAVGRTGAFPPDKTEALTAIGTAVRLRLGQTTAKHPVLLASAQTMLGNPPVWSDDGSIDYYYWFHGSQVFALLGRPHFAEWRAQLLPILRNHQVQQGAQTGSWPLVDPWTSDGGRVYATALNTLSLTTLLGKNRLLPAQQQHGRSPKRASRHH